MPDPEVRDAFSIDKRDVIRKFDLPAINAQLDKAIASLPADKAGAAVVVVNKDEVKVAIIGKKRVGPGDLAWTVVGTQPFDGNEPAIEGQVRFTWP